MDISKVADAAMLSLTDEEAKTYSEEIEQVLAAFSLLSEIDTSDVESTFQPVGEHEKMRGDIVKDCISKEEALRDVPTKKDDFIVGPRTV